MALVALRTVLRSSRVVVSAGLAGGLVLSIAGGRVLEHWIEGTVRDPIIASSNTEKNMFLLHCMFIVCRSKAE